MVWVGGMGYCIDISKLQGSCIIEMMLLKIGECIDFVKIYVVFGWVSVNEGIEGFVIWDVVENYVCCEGIVMVVLNIFV